MAGLRLGTVLVVDDEVELMRALREMLGAQGYDTLGVTSGQAALEALRERDFDLLLADLMMPGMDGIALLRAALELQPNLVGILMTGQGTVQTAVEAMKVGAFDYLLKPFKLGALLPLLSRAVEVRRLRLENLQFRETVAIYELSQAVAFTLDLNTILNKVADAALQQLGADEASVLLPTRNGEELYVAVVRGEQREHLLGQRVPLDRGVAGWVARSREQLVLHGAVDDPRFAPARPRAEIRTAISMPMLVGGRLAGVLNVNAMHGSFTLGQVKGLSILAGTAASAVENARLYQEAQLALAELRQAQQQVIQRERLSALGQMASGIAHDLNNALSPIVGYTDLLLGSLDGPVDRGQAQQYLRLIGTAAEDAANIVARLREFYRSRDEAHVSEPIEVASLVVQVISLTQPRWRDQAQAAGALIGFETDLEAAPRVLGDPSELREVLVNLVFNAVDAMPEGGTITIRARPRGEQVALEVGDTGVGMSEEVRQRCLEPFFTTKGERGTGLGLGMAYGVMHRHGGALEIASQPGRGTTVTLLLPMETEASAQPAIPPSSQSSVAPLRILVVDDEPALRRLVAIHLQADGHAVEVADNGREGLERFQAGPFDVVITDRAMPGMAGDQLAAEVKRLAPGVPVVLLTGFGSLMQATEERPPGVDVVLAKPVRVAELRRALAQVAPAAGEAGRPVAVASRSERAALNGKGG